MKKSEWLFVWLTVCASVILLAGMLTQLSCDTPVTVQGYNRRLATGEAVVSHRWGDEDTIVIKVNREGIFKFTYEMIQEVDTLVIVYNDSL